MFKNIFNITNAMEKNKINLSLYKFLSENNSILPLKMTNEHLVRKFGINHLQIWTKYL